MTIISLGYRTESGPAVTIAPDIDLDATQFPVPVRFWANGVVQSGITFVSRTLSGEWRDMIQRSDLVAPTDPGADIIPDDESTVHILWYHYGDGSGFEVVRVYRDRIRANQDFDLVKENSYVTWNLTSLRFTD